MSEEDVLAVVPAPEQEATTAPEPELQQSDDAPVKVFTQEDVDTIVSKRLAKAERKWAKMQTPSAPVVPVTPPSLDQFGTVDEYAEARAEQILQTRQQQARHSEIVSAYQDREEDARDKYEDFEQVAYNPNLPITTVMAQTIQASEIGPEVAYYLGANPKEADRISRLEPMIQAKEIGRIEAKLVTDPPVKKSTSAPSPISPVTARNSGNPAFDTTDPRSVKTMSASEWIAADRLRQRKKWEAAHR
tara:strand:- start:1062 stop:1799 length:738 start_codon:yes stop_codon:yes gene_type:complete